jgi:hypothetical protein
MAFVDGEQHGFLAEWREVQPAGAAAGEGEEGEVEAAVADLGGHVGRVALAGAELDVGVVRAEGGKQRRDVDRPGCSGLHDPERHGAAQAAADGVDGFARGPGGDERRAGLRQ